MNHATAHFRRHRDRIEQWFWFPPPVVQMLGFRDDSTIDIINHRVAA